MRKSVTDIGESNVGCDFSTNKVNYINDTSTRGFTRTPSVYQQGDLPEGEKEVAISGNENGQEPERLWYIEKTGVDKDPTLRKSMLEMSRWYIHRMNGLKERRMVHRHQERHKCQRGSVKITSTRETLNMMGTNQL